MNLKGIKINFLGDSITEGCGISCNEARFSEIVSRLAELGEMRNYGISGTRIANQLNPQAEYYDWKSYCQRYDEMSNDADVVVVFGGTNDYGHGDAPFGSFSDRTPETFCGALHYLMTGLINKYPTSIIVFMTPLHREGDVICNPSNNLPLKAYVDAIKETAEFYSIPVLDLFSCGGIQPNIKAQKETLCPDGLHPNDAGHQKIADRLMAFLRNF